jgi:signal peptidase I
MKRRGGGSRPEVDCAGVLQSAEIAVIFVNFAGFFLFQAFRIPTASMVDNLLVAGR